MASPRLTLCVVDDEETIRLSLSRLFSKNGYEVFCASTGADAIELVSRCSPDIILLDLVLPDIDGIEVLRKIRQAGSSATTIMMSAHANVERTVAAMKEGAENFVTKPIDLRKLEALVETMRKYVHAEREIEYYRRRQTEGRPLVGVSEHAQKLHQLIELMAENAHTTVLLLGESGTGKGVVAGLIHERSPRRDRPFVEVSCAELTLSLLESELFGHERGAFTDAKQLKKGLVEVADGGTLFLDEVGELSPSLQPKLLKILETKTFRRVGGIRDMRADVRIVAATNVDLEEMVESGAFREDLYYRLKVMPVNLAPLRERPDDLPPLINHFVAMGNRSLRRRIRGVTEDAQNRLVAYRWPGNIRELRNVLERAMILAKGEFITVMDLPAEIMELEPSAAGGALPSLEKMERELVARTLAAHSNNRTRTALSLGISRSTLLQKIRRYQLD